MESPKRFSRTCIGILYSFGINDVYGTGHTREGKEAAIGSEGGGVGMIFKERKGANLGCGFGREDG